MSLPPETFLHGELFFDRETLDAVSDARLLAAMLAFEAALAEAEAAVGVIPAAAARSIRACCDTARIDRAELARRTTLAGNPAIPLVAMLTAAVRQADPEAAEFVHYGATSQDVIDSAWGLVAAGALALMQARLEGAAAALAALAERHRRTPMAGRTLLQQALPVSFGMVAANWLESVTDARAALARHTLPWLQLGGATGTLAALGGRAGAVVSRLASAPPFAVPGGEAALPWHTNRTRVMALGCDLAVAVATLGKIARDVTLLMQTEVAEVFEPSAPGKGGSSTLPHKRNPVQALAIQSAAIRAPGLAATLLQAAAQELQRGAGGWHAEWETLRALLGVAGTAAFHARALLEGLEVDAARMRANLDVTGGMLLAERVAFALAPSLGKARAKTFLEEACRSAVAEGRPLAEWLAGRAEVGDADLAALFEPATYLGIADTVIDRALERHARRPARD
jgi:3-carboxy-cis,cis-muconate cycloisomerase